MIEKIVQFQTKAGTPLKISTNTESVTTITPLSNVLTLHFPFGAFIWNRPTAVEFDDGHNRQRLQIIDLTRIVQLGMVGLNILFLGTTIVNLISKRKGKA